MTVDEVLQRVEDIRAVAHDGEAAHSKEDALHVDVLRVIAEMGERSDAHPDLAMAELARAALTTLDIEFARWCA